MIALLTLPCISSSGFLQRLPVTGSHDHDAMKFHRPKRGLGGNAMGHSGENHGENHAKKLVKTIEIW
jgi:hypothetical protein